KNYNIVSKVCENITVDLGSSKTFSLLRPSSGIGNIEILSASLMSDVSIENDNVINLKTELNKCKKRLIRVVEDRFFANDGAYIEFDKNIKIETNLPNMNK